MPEPNRERLERWLAEHWTLEGPCSLAIRDDACGLLRPKGPFNFQPLGVVVVFFGVFLSEQREQVALAGGLEANVVALCRWVYYG